MVVCGCNLSPCKSFLERILTYISICICVYITDIYIYVYAYCIAAFFFFIQQTKKETNKQSTFSQALLRLRANSETYSLSLYWTRLQVGVKHKTTKKQRWCTSKSLDFLPFEHKVLLANHVATCPDFKASQ